MDATIPTTQVSAPAISLATLRTVLAKGQAAHPELASRMERAAMIVALRRIDPAVSGIQGCYWVEASDGSREYWVMIHPDGYRGDRCTCKDYQGRGGPCKHAIAVRLLQACERAEVRRREPIPLPQRAYADDDRFELTELGEAYLATQQPDPAA